MESVKNMPVKGTCCCCFPTKTGLIILGVFSYINIILHCLGIVYMLFLLIPLIIALHGTNGPVVILAMGMGIGLVVQLILLWPLCKAFQGYRRWFKEENQETRRGLVTSQRIYLWYAFILQLVISIP